MAKDDQTLKDLLNTQKETVRDQKEVNKNIQKLHERFNKPIWVADKDPKSIEEVKEKKAENKKFLDSLKSILKVSTVGKDGTGGMFGGIKKMMSKYKKIIITMLGVGLVALLSQLDMKKVKEMWIKFKLALNDIYDTLHPIAMKIKEYFMNTALPATVTMFMEQWDHVTALVEKIKGNFEGWNKKTTGEKFTAIKDSFLDIGTWAWAASMSLVDWGFKLLGYEGSFTKDVKEKFGKFFGGVEQKGSILHGMMAMMDSVLKFILPPDMAEKWSKKIKSWLGTDKSKPGEKSVFGGLGDIMESFLGLFAISYLLPGGTWARKALLLPFRLAIQTLLFGVGGLVNIIASSLGISWIPGLGQGGGKPDAKGGKGGKGQARHPKGTKIDGKNVGGQYKKNEKGIWNAVKKAFGKGAGIFKRIGMSLVMPLMSMGPVGWTLLAGLAIGGIIFLFWDDISNAAEKAYKSFKKSMIEYADTLSKAVGGAKNMAISMLRENGMNAIADKIAGVTPPPDRFDSDAHALTPEQRKAKLKKLKEEEEGGARFYTSHSAKLKMAEQELLDLENESMRLARLETGTIGRFGTAGDVGAAMMKKRNQISRLNKERDAQNKKNEKIKKEMDFLELKSLGLIPDELLNVDISGTGKTGFDKLSDNAKIKTNLLANVVGGLRMTSGWRKGAIGDAAMLKSSDTLQSKYDPKWLTTLTKAEKTAGAGTEERKEGIRKMRLAGFFSQHEHGNAIDFSWPEGYNENFTRLQTDIKAAFPGAKLIEESDHLHMTFDRKVSGLQLAQAATQKGLLSGGGGKGNTTTTVYNKQGDKNDSYHPNNPVRNTQPELSHASD